MGKTVQRFWLWLKASQTNRDLMVVWLLTIATYLAAYTFDLYERFVVFISSLENFGGYQAVLPTFVFTLCIAWFAYRRWLDSMRETRKLRQTEDLLRYRVKELETLREASLRLTSSLSLQEVLVSILELARQLVSADDAHLFAYDGEALQFQIAYWNGRYQNKPVATPRLHGFTYTVARQKAQLVIPNVNLHPIYQDWQWGGAIVGLPLCIGEEVRGVMSISYKEPHEFNEGELRILRLLADQAAIALHNASLHAQVQQQAAELEQRVQERTAELTEANEELSQYAYAVAHDLQTPLRGVRNYADFLHEDLAASLAEEQERYLHGLTRAVTQAEALVEGLLLLSQIGGRDVPRQQVEMGTLLSDLVTGLGLSDEVQVTMGEVWPVLWSEPTLLRQIFQNLIVNGIKFNESAVKKIELGWRCDRPDEICFWVCDNGIGIDSQYQEQIFGVFERLHAPQVYSGTGIGLALVRKAVRRLNGRIWLQSTVGQGSTFFVALPANP
ncbi:MAG: GAF domain-containing protein [Ardenticatenaceae bacterium]|nr:GAF domain-containing protein [Ardenticatenaceae bacterium]